MKPWKNRLIHIIVIVIFIVVFLGMINAGYKYFSPEKMTENHLLTQNHPGNERLVQKEFLSGYDRFCRALGAYFTIPSFWFGVLAALVLYCWMILRLFCKYFHMYKGFGYLDIILHPKTMESIPHCLLVLGFYFIFLSSPSLHSIMMLVYILISLPFVYKMLEDVFTAAEKEGIVETYLNKRKSNLALIMEFLRKRTGRLVIIPVLFLIMLMVYWDFLYASINVTGDEKSAPAVFFSNFNNEFFVNYPVRHNALILFHIGLFAIMMFLILYLVSIAGGKKHE